MDPMTAALLATTVSGGLGAIGQGASNRAQRKAQKPAIKFQEKRNALIDQLLASLGGDGQFGDLFKADEAAFQKSFVEPAKSTFRNQIAPQIQQQSIAGGLQRGTGLDDQLLRAGVDLDSILNQQYASFQENAKNRAFSGIGSVLGAQNPQVFQPGQSPMNPLFQAGMGFLGSKAFSQGSGGSQARNSNSGASNSGAFQGTSAQSDMLTGKSSIEGLLSASSTPRSNFARS